MTTSIVNKTEPFQVNVSLCVEPDRYLRDMAGATFFGMKSAGEGNTSASSLTPQWSAPQRGVDASTIGSLADFAARCEAEGKALGFEIRKKGIGPQLFDLMSIDEVLDPSKFVDPTKSRRNHDLSVYPIGEGKAVVVFRHGKFGKREQTFSKLSEALHCLRDLMQGHPGKTLAM